ncbi:MAG TPA: T9SS type A sorting domain-containing protein, partial [Saprospiraceae bacterium]|nr:T9SS type A sorting domain-containing protein [Saprospiraceae bacterium]
IWTSAGVTNIKVSVWDESWNTDFCEVELKIIYNGGNTRVAGNVSTEDNRGLMEASIIANAALPEYPKTVLTDIVGNYGMDLLLDTELSASKEGDDINGVSTLDIVMIQRHILGLEALNSPYKLIAADATNDSQISASDLTEIRKLVLGIISKYSKNNSWRFVVKGSYMNPLHPFPFVEKITVPEGQTTMVDFVAVKIGDVNQTSETNLKGGFAENRSIDKVSLSIAEANVAAGELVTIPVTASNFVNVSGFQYTMNLNGASFVSIEKGALDMSTANVGNLGNGVVTMSYAGSEGVTLNEGEVLFTMVVRGEKASKVSEIFSLTSAVTKAESYNGDLKVGAINLEVRTAPVASIELYQNEPNPFKGQTTVSFMMPEAGAATLSVYDMTGKLVVTRSISAVKGLNSEVFTKDQLGVSGVMYYTLESGDFTATKKMIIVE